MRVTAYQSAATATNWNAASRKKAFVVATFVGRTAAQKTNTATRSHSGRAYAAMRAAARPRSPATRKAAAVEEATTPTAGLSASRFSGTFVPNAWRSKGHRASSQGNRASPITAEEPKSARHRASRKYAPFNPRQEGMHPGPNVRSRKNQASPSRRTAPDM